MCVKSLVQSLWVFFEETLFPFLFREHPLVLHSQPLSFVARVLQARTIPALLHARARILPPKLFELRLGIAHLAREILGLGVAIEGIRKVDPIKLPWLTQAWFQPHLLVIRDVH